MKRAIVLLAGFAMAGTVSLAAGGSSVSGQYVEARTAEVFTGGCIMGSEAETMGKQAVLAWKIDRGSVNGVSVDGLPFGIQKLVRDLAWCALLFRRELECRVRREVAVLRVGRPFEPRP